MNHSIRNASLGLGLALALAAAQAPAATLTLPLGGLKSGASIGNYFDGFGDNVPTDGIGPDLGILFSSNATAQKAGTTSTSDGRFENEPSTQGEVLFFSSAGGTMNVPNGFFGLSFDYSVSGNNSNLGSTSAYQSATVDLWSGLNGTGTMLDALTLTPVTNPVACANHGDVYCNWSLATTGATNIGKVESVTFGATSAAALTEFDDVQLNTVPLPAAAWLMVSGLAGLGGFMRRRRAAG
jgi:hypothetical protein